MNSLTNKRILVTGACGTVGKELLKKLTDKDKYSPIEVVAVDQDESGLFFLEQLYIDDPRTSFFLCNIRDEAKLRAVMKNIDVVFHSAALKHVSLCEVSPLDAVQSNIQGVQNVIDAANDCGVEVVIFTSSDKAVNPTNVMGTTKLMGERLITAANNARRGGGAVFASTRFGNVLGSNGSVIPIFKNQIAAGGPVTLTDPEMTRFIMSIDQAADLVLSTADLACGGEVFITKMPVIRIKDLAEVMIQKLAPLYGHKPEEIEIKVIGSKPGEKLYEELMSDEETRRSIELENYFAVVPAFKGFYEQIDYEYDTVVSEKVDNPYHSGMEPALTQSELLSFLEEHNLLSDGTEEAKPVQRYWPGDKK